MLNRPPRHRADAVPVYIDIADGAWDWERVAKERAAMVEAKQDDTRHPVTLYLGGVTRYDLDASFPVLGEMRTVKDYVDLTKCWRFNLKRLHRKQWYEVKGLHESNPDAAMERACQMSLESIDGPDAPPVKRGPDGVSDVTMEHLFHDVEGGPMLIPRIGQAAYLASLPLSDAEGK